MKRRIVLNLMLLLVLSACTPRFSTVAPVSTPVATTPPTQTVESGPAPTQTDVPTSISSTPTASPVLPGQGESPTPAPMLSPSPTTRFTDTPSQPSQPSQAIIVDHTSVDLFEQIPEEYLSKARALKMVFVDASVGKNIDDTLSCLTSPNWAASPSACRNDYIDPDWNWKTFNRADLESGRVPPRILFTPDPVKYNRQNWIFEPKGGGWTDLAQAFINDIAPSYLDSTDVLSFQFNYFHVADFSNIADPNKGFFAENSASYDYKDLENLIAQHPDKTFFYWTTSLARSIGTQVAVDFNNQMRQYVLENNLILLDAADILSHTDQGLPCYDNRDAIEYCSLRADGSTIKCENEPDDGLQIPAICQDYTTEPDAGHLGSVSAGGIRLAKAMWVLMARIAGWQP